MKINRPLSALFFIALASCSSPSGTSSGIDVPHSESNTPYSISEHSYSESESRQSQPIEDVLAFRRCLGGIRVSCLSEANYPSNLVIPDEFQGRSVVEIGSFADCVNLKTVTLPDTIVTICASAFRNCSSLQRVNIPGSVTSIGDYAFNGCSSLQGVNIPASVTSIGYDAFSSCDSLTSITVAEGNPKFDSRSGCNAIIETKSNTLVAGCSTTRIPGSVASIGVSAFSGCSSLQGVNIPDSVVSIESSAFYDCSSLQGVNIPGSVTSIGYGAFRDCSSLQGVNIPGSVTSIGYDAFSSCDSLTSITVAEGNPKFDTRSGCNAIIETKSNTLVAGCSTTRIPSSVASIGYGAFRDCSSLQGVYIPDSVTSIGDDAFYGCSSLQGVNIPGSVTSIGDFAFADCGSLTSITVAEGNPFFDSRSGCNAIIETKSNTLVAGCSATRIPASVTSIDVSAFRGCSSLRGVNIPASVASIASGAFSSCDSLTSITVAEGNTFFDSRSGCNAIIETWSDTLVAGCSTTRIPASVTSIGDDAFYGCSSLQGVNIPASVTSIGDSAFADCSSLQGVNIPASVTSIGWFAFADCSSLQGVNIPASVTSIGYGAFTGCSSLQGVNIPASVASIGDGAFANCSSLEFVVLPDTLIEVDSDLFGPGNDLFYGCSKLSSVFINGDSYTGPEIDFGSATVYYYVEQQPAEPGNYWHYVDGVPTPW